MGDTRAAILPRIDIDLCFNSITVYSQEYYIGVGFPLVAVGSGELKMQTSAVYSADGNYLVSSTDAVGNTVSYETGSNGLVSKATDPKGTETNYTYDSMRRTTAVQSEGADVAYTYANDAISKISVDGGALQYSFAYDTFGRNTKISVGNGTNEKTLATYVYTDDLLTRQYYGDVPGMIGSGDSTTEYVDFTYDSFKRIIRNTFGADADKYISFAYDPSGNLYETRDNIWGKKIFYEYDLAGRNVGTSVVDLSGTMNAYEKVRYNDGKGTVKSLSHTMYSDLGEKLRTISYAYTYGEAAEGEIPDALYALSAGGRSFTYTYDSLGRLATRSLALSGTTVSENYAYLANKNNANYTTGVVSSMTDFLGLAHTYTYDENGNILTETYNGSTVTYEYDSMNRMTRFNDPVSGRTYVYTYDDRGNITSMQDYDYSAGALPSHGATFDYTYGDSTWADLLTAYDGETITYDSLGNPQNWINGEELTWENGRQLTSVDSYLLSDYTYNADGLRTSKAVEGTNFTQNTEYRIVNGQYIGEITNINGTEYVIAYVYDESGAPAGLNINGGACYFVKNLQGDVIAIVDYQGNLIAKYRYDAYGYIDFVTDANGNNITSNTHIAYLNPFRYRGYMYDDETGFYYLRSRYYDPYTGRFLNADSYVSTGQGFTGFNMFAYCNCNPVMFADYVGNCPEGFIGPCQGPGKCKNYQDPFESYQYQTLILTIDRNSPPDHPDYKPPKKGGGKKVRNPNGEGWGWPAKDGGVWMPDPDMHGGEGWTIQYPGGGHSHAYPSGGVRNHFESEHSTGTSVLYLVLAALATAYLAVDDITGVGASNDGLIPITAAFFMDNLENLQGKKICSECGEVIYD